MGVVYLVEEEGRAAPIALKLLLARRFTESALRHFEQEFRILTSLAHPYLTEVYDFGRHRLPGEEGQAPFFTMEFVEGETLDRYFQRSKEGLHRTYDLLAQVAQALAYLHANGLVHQDVKPSNIMVTDTPEGPKVKLMDLGLAGRPREQGSTGSIRGTAAYLSPEAAKGGPVDPRSDLYSLGCVAYEIATGRPPFRGESFVEVIRGHLLEQPLPPSVLNRTVPPPYEDLILRLLAKDPGQRPSSAHRFLRLLDAVAGGNLSVGTSDTARRRVLGGGFIGRQAELARLQGILEEVRRGAAHAVWIVGSEGVGKSRLLREFQVHSQIQGVEVFMGRPSGDGSGSGALGTALSSALKARGPVSEAVLALHGEALEPLLPALPPTRKDGPSTAGAERFRCLAALDAVIHEILQTAPVVFALEDLHDADETTCWLLRHLLRGMGETLPRAGRYSGLLLVGTYRPEELTRASPLFDLLTEGREAGHLEEIVLDPFGPEETAALLRTMLGTDALPAAFLERIREETRGNPLHLGELMAMLAEEGHVEPGSENPLNPAALARVELPRKTRDLFERRLAGVKGDPLRVLRAAAVLGAVTIDPDIVAAITGMRWEAIVRHLLELVRTGLAERDDEEDIPRYRFAHPALRHILAETLPPDESSPLHARAVSYLERRGIPRRHSAWADVARHAEAAGLPGRAVEAYRRAGDLARQIHALREAIDLYGRALELALREDDPPAAVLATLYEGRGGAHALIGDLARAEEDFRSMLVRAEKAASDPLRTAAHLALGGALAARERHPDAQEHFEIAVELAARARLVESAARAEIGLARSLAEQGHLEEGLTHLDRARESCHSSGTLPLEIEALLAKGEILRDRGDFRSSLACFEDASSLFRGLPLPALEVAVQEGTAAAFDLQGKPREAIEAYEKARDLAASRGDVRAAARLITLLGVAHAHLADHDRALTCFEESLETHRRLGLAEGVLDNLEAIATQLLHKGEATRAIEVAEEADRLARRLTRRDRSAGTRALAGRVHLRGGDLETARVRLAEAEALLGDCRSPRISALLQRDLGDMRRIEGDAAAARRHYQESAFLARKLGDRRLESAAMYGLGEAHLQDHDHDRALIACRKALQLVQEADFPQEEAMARLLRARIELERPGGDVLRAEIDALEVFDRFRQQQDPERAWQAELLTGKAALRLGRKEEGAVRLERAYRRLEGLHTLMGERWRTTFLSDPRRRELFEERQRLVGQGPALETATPSDLTGEPVGGDFARLQRENAVLRRLIDVNRQMAATRDTEALLRTILDAAVDLTGAERGFLLLGDGAELTTRQTRGAGGQPLEGEALALSRTIARMTLESGEPLLASDADLDERVARSESVHDLGIRSVLAVPLRRDETVIGALYLDSRIGTGVLLPHHLDLARALADQAALALDTAALVSRLAEQRERADRLNEELERTVQAQREELASVREELSSSRSSFELRYRFEDLVGASAAMQRVYHLIERLAPKKLPVLIIGESGTGKELIARALHAKGDRSEGPYFTVNCAALTETLLESELFGYKRGAFTGADRNKPGYFELADQGTLFLDEIGELSQGIQAKLLRALQEGEVLPVGGKSPVKVDVRIVSATNRDLKELIRQGRFREDLYYRINVARIEVPPLRERREDVPLLVDHFLSRLAEDEDQPKKEIEPAALRRLAALDWAGNVRELQHEILRVATFARGPALTLRDFERYGDLGMVTAHGVSAGPTPRADVESLEELERRQILLALEKAGGNKTRAAEILGINRATLFRKLKRFELG